MTADHSRSVARVGPVAFVLALACAMTVAVPAARAASPGTLDTSFSDDGIRRVDFGADDYAQAVFTDGLGRLTVAGSAFEGPFLVALTRLSAEGQLDRSFGDSGKLTMDPTSGNDRPDAWAHGPDGSMVIAGRLARLGSGYYLLRLLADGRVDTTFGDEGLVMHRFNRNYDFVEDVLVLPSGRIAVLYDTDEGLVLHAYRPDGTRIMGFGDRGEARADMDVGSALVYQPTGRRILVAGTRGKQRFVLEAFLPNGARDESYGSRGRATVVVGLRDEDQAIFGSSAATVLADGRVVLAGQRDIWFVSDAIVARFTEDGRPDSTFGGGDGWREIDVGNIDNPSSIVGLAGGRMIVVGTVAEDRFAHDLSTDLMLVGLRSDGRLWRRLGGTGVVRTDFGRPRDTVRGHDAVLTGDTLVVVGTSNTNMLIARFHIAP